MDLGGFFEGEGAAAGDTPIPNKDLRVVEIDWTWNSQSNLSLFYRVLAMVG